MESYKPRYKQYVTDRFKLGSRIASHDYSDLIVIELLIRVPYTNCFGKSKSKYITVFSKYENDLKKENLKSKTEVLGYMIKQWQISRKINIPSRVIKRIHRSKYI